MSDDDITLGEVGRRLTDLAVDVRGRMDSQDAKIDRLTDAVTRLARVDARLDGHDIEIRDLKASHSTLQQQVHESERDRRIPWTSVASVVVSLAALSVTVIPLLARN